MTDTDFLVQPNRRLILFATLGIAMTAIVPPVSATPGRFTLPDSHDGKGNPGDFDFLTGEWRIHNRFLEGENWIEFPGEASVTAILAGIASIEELRIPARDFSGMGLRLFDVERRIWSDHWVNAKSGVVGVPGQIGVFVDGVGTFTSEDGEGADRTIYRGIWDRITPTSCRWYQSWSKDGGLSWTDTWFMDWTRFG